MDKDNILEIEIRDKRNFDGKKYDLPTLEEIKKAIKKQYKKSDVEKIKKIEYRIIMCEDCKNLEIDAKDSNIFMAFSNCDSLKITGADNVFLRFVNAYNNLEIEAKSVEFHNDNTNINNNFNVKADFIRFWMSRIHTENEINLNAKKLKFLQNSLFAKNSLSLTADEIDVENSEFSSDEDLIINDKNCDEISKVSAKNVIYNGVDITNNEEIIMPEIAFPTYEIAAKIKECKYVKIPLKNHGIDLDKTLKCINENTKLIWISNPHNPTGTIISEKDFCDFLNKVPEEVYVVLDEAYVEYMTNGTIDSIGLYNKYKNLIIIRTFSKAYGLAGVRVGYGFAREEIIEKFKVVIGPFDLNSYAQALAVRLIEEDDYVKDVRKINSKSIESYESTLRELNLKYIKSHASFIMIETRDRTDEICNYLLENKIIIKNGKLIGMPGWIRISMGRPEQNMVVLQKLVEFYNN